MKPPCEIIVKHLLPMLRALIAKELSERYGFKQEEAARRLGVTQSAISYYLSESRGATDVRNCQLTMLKENSKVKAAVKEIAEAIGEGSMSTVEIIQRLCETCTALRSGEDICKMHMNAVPSIGGTCNLCQFL